MFFTIDFTKTQSLSFAARLNKQNNLLVIEAWGHKKKCSYNQKVQSQHVLVYFCATGVLHSHQYISVYDINSAQAWYT